MRITGDQLHWKQVGTRPKRRGPEIHHSAEWRGDCPGCGELIEIRFDIWEYPEDHRNDSKLTFLGYPEPDKSDLTKFMHAPLYDEKGEDKIGTFTIKARGKLKVRCAECDRMHETDGEDLIFTYGENEEAKSRAGTIIHSASWRKKCECGEEIGIGITIFSELQGTIYDESFHEKNCELISAPRLSSIQYTPD
jgi:hypothetical protein